MWDYRDPLYCVFQELDTASKMRGLKSTHVHQHAHDETRLRTLRAMRDSSEYTLSSSLTDSTPLTVGSKGLCVCSAADFYLCMFRNIPTVSPK